MKTIIINTGIIYRYYFAPLEVERESCAMDDAMDGKIQALQEAIKRKIQIQAM
jgi:hypothetical protein